MTAASASQGVKSIEVGARLLAALAESAGALPLGELASRADMTPSKAHRYLVSLIRCEHVRQDPITGRYDLGPGALHMGLAALRRLDAVRFATEDHRAPRTARRDRPSEARSGRHRERSRAGR